MSKKSHLRCPCYGGKTLVTTVNEIARKIEMVAVENLIAGVHHVYSIGAGKFIPLVYVAKVGTMKRLMVLRSGTLGGDEDARKYPLRDIYLSKNMKLLSQNNIVRMRDIPAAEKIKTEPEPRYILVTAKPEFIMVSGISVQTKGQESFETYIQKKNYNAIE
jgi:hypothetical protein